MYIKYLTNLVFSVCTVSFGSLFFPLIYGPRALCLGHILVQLQKPLVSNFSNGYSMYSYSGKQPNQTLHKYFSQNKAEVTIEENDNPGGTFEFKNTTAVVLQVGCYFIL